ncbi:MAG: hypothetical protein AAF085_16950, partial [Planctomycetota bacterium]
RRPGTEPPKMARVRGGNAGFAVALVIFGCGFVISLLVAIIFYTKIEEHKVAQQNAEEELAEFISGPETAQANEYKSNNATVFTNLRQEIDDLNIKVRESDGKVASLNRNIAEKDKQFGDVSNDRDELTTQLEAERRTAEQTMNERKEALDRALRENATLNTQKAEIEARLQDFLNNADEAAKARIAELTEQLKVEENAKIAAQQESEDNARLYKLLLASLPEPPRPGTTNPDAEVASVFGANQTDLFITLGRRDGIVMGMNFEVYDPLPVIKLTDTDEARGKATIEVYGLKDDSATCRVVRRDPGAAVNPGDPIVNIAYDPNMEIKMYAFGEFDIERDGGVNDIGRIEALIKESAAELVTVTKTEAGIPILTPDITYVILGEKPELPEEPGRDVFDPVIIAEYQAKVAANEAYFQILDQATILRIPVLSQDRFLDLNGYYVR